MSEALFVATTPGLEAALASELSELGLTAAVTNGGCAVEQGPDGSFVRVNVRSRVASKVWWIAGRATSPERLASVPLTRLIGDGPVELSVSEVPGSRPTVPAERWRNAAVKGWRTRVGADATVVQLRVGKDGCAINVDTSGPLLHFRGARQETGKAPLRETLASGLLRLAGWRPGETVWDPMCGSGTIVIEAAEQCAGLQPGRERGFAFERFPSVPVDRLAAEKRPGLAVATTVMGSDLNAGALGVARRNARRAGVVQSLKLERLDATALARPDAPPGLLIANLPYGKRVGQSFELAGLYAALGARLKAHFSGWRIGLLTLEDHAPLGLKFDAEWRVSNGGLACVFSTGRLE